MSKIFVEDTEMRDIADAIREKNGTENTYKPSEMPQAIKDIESGGEFIGVKYSDFDKEHVYYLPKTADARLLEPWIQEDSNGICCTFGLFSNSSITNNNNKHYALRTVYMPSGITQLSSTFKNCANLVNIIGDLSSVVRTNSAFVNCKALTELPYMPDLEYLEHQSFAYCVSLTSITFYKVLTSWVSNALTGCTNIETINLVDGWNTSIYAQHCPKLTSECVNNMINCLADMAGQNARIIQFHADVKAKLTDDQIAQITNKNWTLA
jgi:hypothetical protein